MAASWLSDADTPLICWRDVVVAAASRPRSSSLHFVLSLQRMEIGTRREKGTEPGRLESRIRHPTVSRVECQCPCFWSCTLPNLADRRLARLHGRVDVMRQTGQHVPSRPSRGRSYRLPRLCQPYQDRRQRAPIFYLLYIVHIKYIHYQALPSVQRLCAWPVRCSTTTRDLNSTLPPVDIERRLIHLRSQPFPITSKGSPRFPAGAHST